MSASRRRFAVTREQIDRARRVLARICGLPIPTPSGWHGTAPCATSRAATFPSGGSIVDAAAWARGCIDGLLIEPRIAQSTDRYLAVLKRFGSFTPWLHPGRDRAVGGGYLLAYEGTGIAIDPGHSFLQNLLSSGHVPNDIDHVIITHAHDDHMTDLIGLHSLVHQQHELGLRRTKVGLLWNRGAARYFSGSRRSRTQYFREAVLQASASHRLGRNGRHRLTVLPAKHTDLTGSRGIGIALAFKSQSGRSNVVLYTGDTGWSSEVGKAYAEQGAGCELLLLHLGGIGPDEHRLLASGTRLRDCLYRQHLGLIGATLLIDTVRPRTAVIGEFGEELDGLEQAIVEAFQLEFDPLGVQVRPALLYEQHKLTA